MSDHLKKKVEETAALQLARRERKNPFDRLGLSTRGTSDAFVEAQMVEQPPPVEPGERDVIVQPTTPPDMGGAMQPPEEPLVPEEPSGEEPEPEEDVDEEMKRSLFNTLSELIDLGRIGRNEQEIRKYVEDHEDEIGELIDVLDDVIDMLVGEGSVLREPKTFDVGDEEEPATGDFDELKPGVGGQVPQGGTTTTIIASDQSRGDKGALHESIMTGIVSGAEIDATLERAAEELTEETLEYGFDSPQDLNRALEVLDGLDVATTNVLKINADTLQIVRDERNKADVDRQLAAIRAAGIEVREPAAAEGAATPAVLVSGPNVGQQSTVQSEGIDEAIFSNWYVVSTHEGGVSAAPHGTNKEEAQRTAQNLNASNPKANAMVVRAKNEKDAAKKYERRTAAIRSPEKRGERLQRGLGVLKGAGKVALAPARKAVGAIAAATKALMNLLKSKEDETPPGAGAPGAPGAPEPADVGPAGPGTEHPPEAVKITIDDPTIYTETLRKLTRNPGTRYARGDGANIWIVSEDPQVKAALEQMAAAVSEAYQSWTRPVMRVRATMGEAEEVSAEFASVKEAENHARDLRDLGYENVILEQLNITRTGMAVEVVFGNKSQAAAAQGALLQYKGVDTVKDAGNGTLVVFTTDADPEEARNRVTTILQNARVPLESFEIPRYREAVLESNPGGQSAIGRPVPGVSRGYNGPDLMPVPVPVASGQSGADLEAEDKCPYCGGSYQDDICINCKRIRPGKMPKADRREGPREGIDEQAGDQDPEMKRRYMQPFYAPEDAGLPPGPSPEEEPVPSPGEPGYEPPEYAGEPEGPPEGPEEPEEAAVGSIWRLDVPEDPEEETRLTDALNKAKEAGVLVSWTEVGAPEEEIPPEGAPEEPVDLEVTPEFLDANRPRPTTPPPLGEQIDDEREYDLPPEEPPAVADVAPDEAPTDELPPEEPEEEEHYIAVEFAAETEEEEREAFPDWITDITADPETGEGGVIIAGWRAEEPGEEMPGEPGEEMPGEPGEEIPGKIPGETSEISPELSPEFSEESPVVRGSPSDEVPVPEERLLGEAAGHLRNIFKAARTADRAGDDANRQRFTEALVKHGHAMRISRKVMARILNEREDVVSAFYVDPKVRKVAKIEAPKPSSELDGLWEDYVAMELVGDERGSGRVMNELRLRAHEIGVMLDERYEGLAGRIYYLSKRGARKKAAGDADEAVRIEKHVDDLVNKAREKGRGDEAEEAKQAGLEAGASTGVEVGEACKQPGRKVRSRGKGRGLARGRGEGPVGVPAGE